MSDKRAIVVTCCRDCPCEEDCKRCQDSLDKNIPLDCLLPKWPSITGEERSQLLGAIDAGISEYMPVLVTTCPGKILKDKLRAIIDKLEVRDAAD